MGDHDRLNRLLCISNGHGEDEIGAQILTALQALPGSPDCFALPLVGEGYAYQRSQIPLIGLTQRMPSGGFIYMDSRQLWRDIQGGLVQLTLKQIRALRQWSQGGGAVLAVGDIVPLLFGRLSGLPYGFVGTAKSDYYLRDDFGVLRRKTWAGRLESRARSVYQPWERWLMQHRHCRAVFLRDSLTTERIRSWSIPAFDEGNPMMDGLVPQPDQVIGLTADLGMDQPYLTLLVLPGSRAPEAYANWAKLLQGIDSVLAVDPNRPLLCLGAIASSLDLEILSQILLQQRWLAQSVHPSPVELGELVEGGGSVATLASAPIYPTFTRGRAMLRLVSHAYAACLQAADIAIAMAGTATEQFVGLGKPAITLPGQGPQFTPAFAEAQTRLLGPSISLVESPDQVGCEMQRILQDPDRLQLIQDNGYRRMGAPGAALRIAQRLLSELGEGI